MHVEPCAQRANACPEATSCYGWSSTGLLLTACIFGPVFDAQLLPSILAASGGVLEKPATVSKNVRIGFSAHLPHSLHAY